MVDARPLEKAPLVSVRSPKDILALFRAKGIDPDWSFQEYKPSETAKWTHGYHRYPAKFIPQLVERLMDEYLHTDEAHINDPFMGCGTTIVTALSRGYRASGTDINGVACLITRVKSRPIDPEYLDSRIKSILSRLRSTGTGECGMDEEVLLPMRHQERIDFWFTPENKLKLGRILRAIQDEEDDCIREFLLVAFSHILKPASRWLQRSTKPTRDLNRVPADPCDAFEQHLRKMQAGNREFCSVVPRRVRERIDDYLDIVQGDARHQPVPKGSVDLIVTSSPYVTSYEYADLHQLSTIWLGMAEDLDEYRSRFIGTSRRRSPNRGLKSSIAAEIVEELRRRSERTAEEVEAFFGDMQGVFEESHRILKHGGRCCYVIGDTRLKGVEILNAEVFAESLQYAGFILDRIVKREIPTKILPQKRDASTGRFARGDAANSEAYPVEYIVIGLKE